MSLITLELSASIYYCLMWSHTLILWVWVVSSLTRGMYFINQMNNLSRSLERTHSQDMYQALPALANICGCNRTIDSLHHFGQSPSPIALFLTETQISATANATHL